jgi:histidinol-phosphate/aromatic aminotransferase/cobyric acid decarboxylase-like protein
MPYNISVFGIAAAITALNDAAHLAQERTRNTQVRDFTVKALADRGCKSSDSQCNFIFTDVGRPAREFRDACAKLGVNVGRDFPPYEHSHVRISIGTMAEMQKATQVFREVLGPATPANGNGRSGRTFDAARR